MVPLSHDGEIVLALCKKLLNTLRIMGPDGRAQFISTLAPGGQACHARPSLDPSIPSPVISYEDNKESFPNRIDWDSGNDYEEGIDDGDDGREIVVLVDHDIAMVWTPYWFKNNGQLTHVGTNCFTLAKDPVEGWKIVGMTDTGRWPSDEDKKRLL
ncbi:hypothetical protein B7463_g9045, partial [Scytalidium lignicola]